ncbi:Mpo1-like protein [Laceyella putida]|uniref:Mpo1-like protein n=1 Tax=Laceyella putida TaxID=110101 RepID=A0ABW2RM66_9BACL
MDLNEFFKKYHEDHQHPINRLLHAIGIPLIIFSLIWFFVDWSIALTCFILGWVFQFVGHWFEGKKPSFFSNPAFLLVGPVYFLKKLFAKKEKGKD